MLDHEEKFLFKEEILHLANAVAEPGALDNVAALAARWFGEHLRSTRSFG